ncbi:hypothetical protein P5V15_004078 [Pogonomyrmex californicus]
MSAGKNRGFSVLTAERGTERLPILTDTLECTIRVVSSRRYGCTETRVEDKWFSFEMLVKRVIGPHREVAALFDGPTR